MLNFSIMQDQGILLLAPSESLRKEDFVNLSSEVDAYLAKHDKLRGVLIQTKGFPGWENFGAFTAHMHFVREHHKQVERIALVTDTPLANVAEVLGKHFIAAEIRHFAFGEYVHALGWLQSA